MGFLVQKKSKEAHCCGTPRSSDYSNGTIWQCDECGMVVELVTIGRDREKFWMTIDPTQEQIDEWKSMAALKSQAAR